VTFAAPPAIEEGGPGALAVLRNRPFLLLWLAQAATQIGGNMVLYGLTVIIVSATRSNSAVSALILTFLVPAVLFSALAGVYVDRLDRRLVLIATNVSRGLAIVGIFLVGDNLAGILVLNVLVSTVTVFFAPAEASMIPILVPRSQLLAANGVFTLTLNAAFALGFALLGPFVVAIAGPEALILFVAILYFVAAVFCITLPPAPPVTDEHVNPLEAVVDAERAVESTLAQLREGLGYIRSNPGIGWSLIYLGIAASLVGVLGVLGPDFARTTLGLAPKDLVVVVLPLGGGLITGILLLNSYGRYLARRRVIEGGLIALGILLGILSVAGPISRFLQRPEVSGSLIDLSAITSLLAVVVMIAFLAGIAYAFVAIPAQTQLQEEIPEDVRGRVFGILNMLVSVSSFLPIIIVGPISDLFGTTAVILGVAALIGTSGVASVVRRGALLPSERRTRADASLPGVGLELAEPAPPPAAPPPAATPQPPGSRRTRRAAGHAAAPEGPTLWDEARPPRVPDAGDNGDPDDRPHP
jgi:MFS family permease